MNIQVVNETKLNGFYGVEMTDGTHNVTVCIFDDGYINVKTKRRSPGHMFSNLEEAVAAYKTLAIKTMITEAVIYA